MRLDPLPRYSRPISAATSHSADYLRTSSGYCWGMPLLRASDPRMHQKPVSRATSPRHSANSLAQMETAKIISLQAGVGASSFSLPTRHVTEAIAGIVELERRHPQPRDGRNVAHVVADSVGKHLARQLCFLLRKAPACWDSRQRRWQPVRHRNPTNSLSIESQTCFAKGNFSWNAMSCKDDLVSAQAAEFAVAFTDHAHLCGQSACISVCRSCWVIFANVDAARLSASCNKILQYSLRYFSKIGKRQCYVKNNKSFRDLYGLWLCGAAVDNSDEDDFSHVQNIFWNADTKPKSWNHGSRRLLVALCMLASQLRGVMGSQSTPICLRCLAAWHRRHVTTHPTFSNFACFAW